ncbi:MAG: hypothetical protein ABIT36_03355 [Steroidobacteraceae bacterium]
MTNFATVVHECTDYAAWKKVYDADRPRREAAGLTEVHVLRDVHKPKLIALMFTVDDLSRAKELMNSAGLKQAMTAAGIVGPPAIRFRTGDYNKVSAPMYATMSVPTKDYATAMEAYGMDSAERKAATLTDIAVLQEIDDPGNLLLMWTVTDVARAIRFFDDPKLAEHMVKNAGVIGPPERHFWAP